jgi:DNA primase
MNRTSNGWPLADDRSILVKQVKEANDIVEVVGGYVSLRPAGPTFKGLCPFHDDSRPSFDVDPRRQRYRCWSCNKFGDVFTFIQEFERVTFPEALELLARRAGINLQPRGASAESSGRALLLDAVRWAEHLFHTCLLDSSLAEEARKYIGERRLTDETVRKYGLGYAPLKGDWLAQQAEEQGKDFELLEKLGLVLKRFNNKGYMDRFRDRVMFPIRDARGQTVGFGGRIMPNSPLPKDRNPKYYNSAESLVFNKSEHLYGLDQARQAAVKAGYLAVVEGYTDVLMAHQKGIPQVVATLGTALNAKHVQQLRRFAPRVVLVFDADAGGNTGVDRALNIFASQDVDLAVATLPPDLDPCDLLVQQGPEPFLASLDGAVDALDFKLNQVLKANPPTIEGKRRVIDAVLGNLALAPEMPGQAGALRRELMVSRIAQRLAVKEETVWARLNEIRQTQRRRDQGGPDPERDHETEERHGPARPEERELLECLLAEPALVPEAAEQIRPEMILNPTVRRLVEGLYRLHAEGEPPDLDQLRLQIEDSRLAERLLKLQEVGRMHPDRPAWLRAIVGSFRKRQVKSETQELQNQLHAAGDHEQALELLRLLQNRMQSMDPGTN